MPPLDPTAGDVLPLELELRESERRVLGNLPAYRTETEHEAAIADALEHGTIASPAEWPRGRTIHDLTGRLARDPHTPLGQDPSVVERILAGLAGQDLVTRDGDLVLMTEAGLAALTA